MKHIPKYLMPKVASATATETVAGAEEKTDDAPSFVPFSKIRDQRGRGRGRGRDRGRGGKFGGRGGKKKSDPLRNFR